MPSAYYHLGPSIAVSGREPEVRQSRFAALVPVDQGGEGRNTRRVTTGRGSSGQPMSDIGPLAVVGGSGKRSHVPACYLVAQCGEPEPIRRAELRSSPLAILFKVVGQSIVDLR